MPDSSLLQYLAAQQPSVAAPQQGLGNGIDLVQLLSSLGALSGGASRPISDPSPINGIPRISGPQVAYSPNLTGGGGPSNSAALLAALSGASRGGAPYAGGKGGGGGGKGGLFSSLGNNLSASNSGGLLGALGATGDTGLFSTGGGYAGLSGGSDLTGALLGGSGTSFADLLASGASAI